MWISQLFEAQAKRVVAIMPGGFHPFHPGHKSLYDWAVGEFGKDSVYVAATNDQETRPFPFEVKRKLAAMAGVPAERFIQVNTAPFNARAYSDLVDSDTALVFVRSEKERNVTPLPDQMKIDKATKKPGNEPRYYRSYTGKNLNTADEMGYIAYGPTVNFGFKGLDIKSASEIRANWPNMTDEEKLDAAGQMYGGNAEEAVELLNTALGVGEGKDTRMIQKDPVAKQLRQDPQFKQRVVPDKTKYNRKKDKGKDMQFSNIQHESYYDDVDPEVAKLGRILMDKAVSQKDENLSGIMATVGSELTKFGSNQGARDLKQLEKRVGLPEAMIKKMMEYAAKFEDETKYRVKDPEPSADDMEDDDFRESAVQESMPETAEELRDKIDEISSMLERQVEHPMTDLTDDREGRMLVSVAQRALSNLAQYADSLGEMSEGVVEGSHSVLDTLQSIVDDKQKKTVQFTDGKMPVDMFTASAVMQVYDAVNDDNKSKIKDAVQTKSGFMKIAEFAMSKAKMSGAGSGAPQRESVEEDSKFDRNFEKRIGYTVRGGAAAQQMKKQAAQAQADNPDSDQGLGPAVLNIPKAREKAAKRGIRAPGNLRASPNTRDPKRLPESCADCGKPVFVTLPEHIQEKYETVAEGKKKGVDGKVCWKGYKRMGTKKKGGKTVDNCVKMSAAEKNK